MGGKRGNSIEDASDNSQWLLDAIRTGKMKRLENRDRAVSPAMFQFTLR